MEHNNADSRARATCTPHEQHPACECCRSLKYARIRFGWRARRRVDDGYLTARHPDFIRSRPLNWSEGHVMLECEVMRKSIEEAWQKAADCAANAEQATDDQTRALFIKLRDSWIEVWHEQQVTTSCAPLDVSRQQRRGEARADWRMERSTLRIGRGRREIFGTKWSRCGHFRDWLKYRKSGGG